MKKDTNINIRVREDFRDSFKFISKAEGLSQSQFLERLLEFYYIYKAEIKCCKITNDTKLLNDLLYMSNEAGLKFKTIEEDSNE